MYKSLLSQIGHHGQPELCFFSEERILSPNGIMTVWGGYAFLRYCDGVIPTTCLKILVKCDIS